LEIRRGYFSFCLTGTFDAGYRIKEKLRGMIYSVAKEKVGDLSKPVWHEKSPMIMRKNRGLSHLFHSGAIHPKTVEGVVMVGVKISIVY